MDDRSAYSYYSHAGGTYSDPQTEAYLFSSSMNLPDPGQSSYIPEPQHDPQSSYIPHPESQRDPQSSYIPHPESQRDPQSSYIPQPEPRYSLATPSPTSIPISIPPVHGHSSSVSSTSSTGRGIASRRHTPPTSPQELQPHSPYPLPSRHRRSPNMRLISLPDDVDDDSDDDPLPPNASEKEKLEWKKRRNTKAARRSRKRKLLYTERLEKTVEQLKIDKETWRTRALTLRQLLKSHNLPYPDFED